MRPISSQGMVQIRGVTYRIERLEPHYYSVVRLLDDVAIGTFRTLPGLRISPLACDVDLFTEIARASLRFGRTSGVMHAVPSPQAEQRELTAQRSPSTLPSNPISA